jgi:hypothetical protein
MNFVQHTQAATVQLFAQKFKKLRGQVHYYQQSTADVTG